MLRFFSSNRSQKGLWHGKDIRTGNYYTFSHKMIKRQFRPNVHFKTYWSNILLRHIRLSCSTKAMRCIKKKGSFDNYILQTSSKDLRSQIGDLLKDYMNKKLKDPTWCVPYIPGQRKAWKSRWERDQLRPYPVWIPSELRHKDLTHLEFDRYDPNAPPRPDIIHESDEERIKRKKAKKEKKKMEEKAMLGKFDPAKLDRLLGGDDD